MSQIKGKDTEVEISIRSELHRKGLRFRKHTKELPGRPDIVFAAAKVVVFIDGDYWHGYRLPAWKHKLTDFWKIKISKNRERDSRNFRKLRKMGWRVIRLWQHEIEGNFDSCVARVVALVKNEDPEHS
jgi:DNA mismatch endonuclease (patch repair protein)